MAKVSEAKQATAAESEPERTLTYLRQHPDLLSQHPELLETLQLNHASGSAVSLIERQVEVLRGKNARLEDRLERLLVNARDNERRANAIQRLARGLIRAPSLAAVVTAVRHSMREDFDIDTVFIGLKVPGFRRHDIEGVLPLEASHPLLAVYENFFRTRFTECGPIDAERATLLFPNHEPVIQSAAVVPLDKEKTIGMIALGAHEAERFQPRQGKLFLDMVGDLVSAAVRARLQ